MHKVTVTPCGSIHVCKVKRRKTHQNLLPYQRQSSCTSDQAPSHHLGKQSEREREREREGERGGEGEREREEGEREKEGEGER